MDRSGQSHREVVSGTTGHTEVVLRVRTGQQPRGTPVLYPKMDTESVRLSLDDGVATITVDRPDALNALDLPTLEALEAATAEAKAETARVLCLEGEGETAFIAGADICYMETLSTAQAQAWAELGHRVALALERFPGPTIAAVDGYALGGGCELALACDLRIAGESALIGLPETDLGVMPGWGGTQRLPGLVGVERAKRMIFLGQPVDAERAREIGLVGEVVPDGQVRSRAAELAGELATRPVRALRAAKEAIGQAETTAGGLAFERRAFAGLFESADQREGMRAFLEDRPAVFD